MSSGPNTAAGWQQAGQTPQPREQIREQVRRDIEQALRQARQEQPNIDEATHGAIEGAVAAARVMAPAGPPVPPGPPALPNGIGILRGRDGQLAISTGTGQPVPFPMHDFPPQIVDIAIAFFLTVAAIFIGTPLARAFARRMDRKGAPAAAASPDVVARLDRIEQAVDAIALEVERISEGQRFVTKMMAEPRALPSPNEAAANELHVMEPGRAERVAAERGS